MEEGEELMALSTFPAKAFVLCGALMRTPMPRPLVASKTGHAGTFAISADRRSQMFRHE